jgi:hypothetical protein
VLITYPSPQDVKELLVNRGAGSECNN